MREREFEGDDLEQVLREAAAALGIPEPDLHYEIVEQGRRGLFGLGARAVRIRVIPPPQLHDESVQDEKKSQEEGKPASRGATPRRPRVRRSTSASTSTDRPAAVEIPDEAVRTVEATVQRIAELMGLDVKVQAAAGPDGLDVAFDGPDQKRLLHKDGEALFALQFLLNRMSRRLAPGAGRIYLSCGETRGRRDEDLIGLAREAAEHVSETGKPRRLRPMNAYERRVVHLTIREIGGLTSRSEGAGALKRVRILPA